MNNWIDIKTNEEITGDVPVSPHTGKPYFGFVYVITNTADNDKQYIGKKFFWTKSRKTKKNPRRKTIQSDWEKYYGSSPVLNAIIKEESFDISKLTREILHFCHSKAECQYLEIYEIYSRNALIKPQEYYNEWVSSRVNRKHLINNIDFLTEEIYK